ncbi:hypothetical protein H8356DRAFT_1667115 [Neocallimastix lanati (nom. inval.)]|nr:hypothetical protein H8356DRAFT_1667115 [Neocallimastix sp. JGI-2020a]
MTSNNRLSMNNTINGSNSQFDSPLDAPPRLTKLFGYMPSEIVSPIKINDDYQQDLQKMEDVTNNFYLSPLNSQSTRSPTITQSFSNLHINTNVSSAGNTPLRSYTNSAGSTPNGSAVVLNNISSISSGHLSAAMDPSVSISPLANKASNLSLSPITTTNNHPPGLNIDPNSMNQQSPVSAIPLNKHFSVHSLPVERIDRGLPNLPNSSQSLGNINSKRFSNQSIPQQPPPPPEPHQTVPSLPRSYTSSSLSTDSLNPNFNNMITMNGSPMESYPQQNNNISLFLNKPSVNKNFR